MPELPEVETVCRTLAPHLIGKSFLSFELLWPRTLATPLDDFLAGVPGKDIVRVDRRAKLIRIWLADGGVITVHLRMTGELLWLKQDANADATRSPYLRAEFLLNDGSGLLFYDTRKFGRIQLLSAEEAETLDAHFGVEPLGHEFTPEWLTEGLSRRKRLMKPLLLDQQFIAGLGNIYVDEALFAAGIHPLTRSDQVDPAAAYRLHEAIVRILSGAIDRRGTTFRDYRSGLGDAGENRNQLLVYGSKSGTACPVCGTPLQRLVVGQRGTVVCPACQPAPPQA